MPEKPGKEKALLLVLALAIIVPMSGNSFGVPVTLSYSVSDDVSVQSCSLWLNGHNSQTVYGFSSALNTFTVAADPGVYKWNVECIDSGGHDVYAANAGPKGYWVFVVPALPPTTTTSSTTTSSSTTTHPPTTTTTSTSTTTTVCKSNTQVCTSGGECCSGVCNCGFCCNSGECGWGSSPPVCVPNGGRRSNQWLDGICVNGRWDTYTCGWGCDLASCSPGGGKFDCYSGSCTYQISDSKYYCVTASCNPTTTTTTTTHPPTTTTTTTTHPPTTMTSTTTHPPTTTTTTTTHPPTTTTIPPCNARTDAGIAHLASIGVTTGTCNNNADCVSGVCVNNLCCPAGYCGHIGGTSATNLCYKIGQGTMFGNVYWLCYIQGFWQMARGESCVPQSNVCCGLEGLGCLNNYCCKPNQCGFGSQVAHGTCYDPGQTATIGGIVKTCCGSGYWDFPSGHSCVLNSECCSNYCAGGPSAGAKCL